MRQKQMAQMLLTNNSEMHYIFTYCKPHPHNVTGGFFSSFFFLQTLLKLPGASGTCVSVVIVEVMDPDKFYYM